MSANYAGAPAPKFLLTRDSLDCDLHLTADTWTAPAAGDKVRETIIHSNSPHRDSSASSISAVDIASQGDFFQPENAPTVSSVDRLVAPYPSFLPWSLAGITTLRSHLAMDSSAIQQGSPADAATPGSTSAVSQPHLPTEPVGTDGMA